MKYLGLLYLLICLAACSISEGVDDMSKHDGNWIWYEETGKKGIWIPTETNELLSGSIRYWHPNGAISFEGRMKENKPVQHWKYYDTMGVITKEIYLLEPDKSSIVKFFSGDGSIPDSIVKFPERLHLSIACKGDNGVRSSEPTYGMATIENRFLKDGEVGNLKVYMKNSRLSERFEVTNLNGQKEHFTTAIKMRAKIHADSSYRNIHVRCDTGYVRFKAVQPKVTNKKQVQQLKVIVDIPTKYRQYYDTTFVIIQEFMVEQ